MAIELKTDISLPYVDSEDAFDLFATVVQNGQTRLALEVLVDILVAVLDKVNELDETVSAIVEFLSEDETNVDSSDEKNVLEKDQTDNEISEQNTEAKQSEAKNTKQKESNKKTQTEEIPVEKI